jgi:hypothetical protein
MTAPPKLERLIAALSRLGNSEIAEKHAGNIFSRMISVVTPVRGHDIGGDDDTGFYARPRTEIAGPERELRDLGGKARKAARGKLGFKAWTNAWAALPRRTKQLLWRPKLVRTAEGHRTIDRDTIAGSFAAPGLHTIVPKPGVVLPLIEAEIARIKTTPAIQRRLRKRDTAEQAAIEAIRAAYQALTGRKGRRVLDVERRLTGRFYRLGREIDDIFGTKLFAAKDSRRLR